jgi:AcrR family transcriptional regulator
MARPLSDDRRNAILAAATKLIAENGLGASTADIARQAGVPNGSVFTYFETKADLLNALYSELKTELTGSVLVGMPEARDARTRLCHIWGIWTQWGTANPLKRKALAQLAISDQIRPETREAVMKLAAPTFGLVQIAIDNGAMRDAPPGFAHALFDAMVTRTMEFMSANPAHAREASRVGFEALWKMLA